jgi:L-serine/L-threonine ammonia-lyase
MMVVPDTDMTSVGSAARSLKLFRETPIVRSNRLSAILNRDVYFKLDSMQASGSFKDRGMGHLCHTLQTQLGTTKLISSSGGNAGLAAATVGQALEMNVMVIVPETTKPHVIEKLRSLNANVQIHGENWNAADQLARELVDKDPTAAYISPYDNPLLWTGHSTVVDEIFQDVLPHIPAAIIASVGGGGLLCGILEGLQRQNSKSTTVIAAETVGASCFGQSFEKNEMIQLDKIDSIATSLGALQATPVALERAKNHQKMTGNDDTFQISICSDAEAVDACVKVRDQ